MSYGKAEELLTYYLRMAWEGAGLGWTSDNDSEARDVIVALKDAVRKDIEAGQ